MSLLATGAGAAKGLRELMADMLAEDRQSEVERSNRADEGYRDRALNESSEFRKLQQRALEENRRVTDADRDDARHVTEQNATRSVIAMRPAGQEVGQGDYENERGRGIPDDFYEKGAYAGMTGDDASEPRSVIKFRGTSQELTAAERRELEERRQGTAEHREDRITGYGPPVVPVSNPSVPGGSSYVPRSEAPGQSAPQPAAQRQKIDAYKLTLQLIKDVKDQGEKAKWGGLGPIKGPVGSLLMGFTGRGNPDEEALRTKIARLRAQASFAEGGKNFTPTERDLVDSFLATVNRNPAQAKIRLDEFELVAKRTLQELGAGEESDAGGGNGPDPYQDYLNRHKP